MKPLIVLAQPPKECPPVHVTITYLPAFRAETGVVRVDLIDDDTPVEPLRKWRSREEREANL